MENAHTSKIPAHLRGKSQPLNARVFPAHATPKHAREAREQVLTKVLDTDILGARGRQPWDFTTTVDKPAADEEKIRTAVFSAGKPVSQRATAPKKETAKKSEKEDIGGGWNKSTATVSAREASAESESLTRKSLEATAKRRRGMLRERARGPEDAMARGNTRGVYVPPSTRTELVQSRRRERVALERSIGKEELERREAIESKRRERELRQTKRDKSNWVRVAKHTGTWSYSAVERSEVWSCCASSVHGSEGCDVKMVNPDAWNVSSIR